MEGLRLGHAYLKKDGRASRLYVCISDHIQEKFSGLKFTYAVTDETIFDLVYKGLDDDDEKKLLNQLDVWGLSCKDVGPGFLCRIRVSLVGIFADEAAKLLGGDNDKHSFLTKKAETEKNKTIKLYRRRVFLNVYQLGQVIAYTAEQSGLRHPGPLMSSRLPVKIRKKQAFSVFYLMIGQDEAKSIFLRSIALAGYVFKRLNEESDGVSCDIVLFHQDHSESKSTLEPFSDIENWKAGMREYIDDERWNKYLKNQI